MDGFPDQPRARRPIARRSLIAAGAAGLLAPRPAPAQSSFAIVGKDGWLFAVWDKVSEDEPNQVKQAAAVVTRAIGILRAARIEVTVIVIPSKARTYRQFLPDNMHVAPAADRRYANYLADLRQAGALSPDLDTVFRARAAGTQLFFKSDTHWTPMGAELAAVETAKVVGPALPPSSRPGLQVSALVNRVSPRGDLVRNLPEAQRAAYAPEPYQIRDVVAPAGANALLADDAAEVTVVGSSYMEPRYAFQPVFSNQIARPVGLFWKPNSIGPFATLLQYLTSPDFRQRRPRMLVWTQLELDMPAGPSSAGWGGNAMSPDKFLNDLRQAVAA